jgi:putative FmdB family regulatory protein
MPTYTYRCQSCGVEFERVQKFNDKPLTRCPECRKGTVRRVPQATAIVFKGSGWYATDHRSPSGNGHKSDKAETSEKAGSDNAAKSEAKTDSKSESKTESKTNGEVKPPKKDIKPSSDN